MSRLVLHNYYNLNLFITKYKHSYHFIVLFNAKLYMNISIDSKVLVLFLLHFFLTFSFIQDYSQCALIDFLTSILLLNYTFSQQKQLLPSCFTLNNCHCPCNYLWHLNSMLYLWHLKSMSYLWHLNSMSINAIQCLPLYSIKICVFVLNCYCQKLINLDCICEVVAI